MKMGNAKKVKCKMIIDQKEVVFQLDAGASMNMLPKKYADDLQTYNEVQKMWDGTTVMPAGKCKKSIRNPKTGKKYNVELIVFDDNCQPLLGLRTSQQMKLIKVHMEEFKKVAVVRTMEDKYPDVFSWHPAK